MILLTPLRHSRHKSYIAELFIHLIIQSLVQSSVLIQIFHTLSILSFFRYIQNLYPATAVRLFPLPSIAICLACTDVASVKTFCTIIPIQFGWIYALL